MYSNSLTDLTEIWNQDFLGDDALSFHIMWKDAKFNFEKLSHEPLIHNTTKLWNCFNNNSFTLISIQKCVLFAWWLDDPNLTLKCGLRIRVEKYRAPIWIVFRSIFNKICSPVTSINNKRAISSTSPLFLQYLYYQA